MPSGSCVCGAVTYSFTGEPALTALCHCTECQKFSGSASSFNVAVPRANFKITKGTPKTYTRLGDSGKDHKLFFCGNCGSSLYSQADAMPDVTLIKAGTLEAVAANVPIGIEFFTRSRKAWAAPVKDATQAVTMS